MKTQYIPGLATGRINTAEGLVDNSFVACRIEATEPSELDTNHWNSLCATLADELALLNRRDTPKPGTDALKTWIAASLNPCTTSRPTLVLSSRFQATRTQTLINCIATLHGTHNVVKGQAQHLLAGKENDVRFAGKTLMIVDGSNGLTPAMVKELDRLQGAKTFTSKSGDIFDSYLHIIVTSIGQSPMTAFKKAKNDYIGLHNEQAANTAPTYLTESAVLTLAYQLQATGAVPESYISPSFKASESSPAYVAEILTKLESLTSPDKAWLLLSDLTRNIPGIDKAIVSDVLSESGWTVMPIQATFKTLNVVWATSNHLAKAQCTSYYSNLDPQVLAQTH